MSDKLEGRSMFDMVPTGRLKIDPKYQRALNEKRVAAMAAEWSSILAQTIDVSVRNGAWYVIDGQHRLAAARRANVDRIAAIVHADLSPSDEARLFDLLNTRRIRPTISDIFRARLEAGDEAAGAIVRAAAATGVTVDTNRSGGSAKRPMVTRAVGALIGVHTAGGESLVRQTLASLREAWPEDRQALDATPIYGVAGFIVAYRDHPRYEYPRIARKLGELSAGAFLRRVNALVEGGTNTTGGGGVQGTIVQKAGPRRAVLEAFNRDLRGERLPDATMRDFLALARGKNPWAERDGDG